MDYAGAPFNPFVDALNGGRPTVTQTDSDDRIGWAAMRAGPNGAIVTVAINGQIAEHWSISWIRDRR